MSAQPIHPHPEPDRVPRNAEGIAAAEHHRRAPLARVAHDPANEPTGS
ncbi:hypothetical protein [Streptomyces sp. BRA346]